MPHQTALGDDARQRIETAADRVESAREALRLAEEQRNRAIAAGVDGAGLTQSLVARLARVSQPHVVRILARVSAVTDPMPAT